MGYEERALAGAELGFKLDLTTTLSMSTAVGQWEEDDGLGGWSTKGRMAVGWRPHPWFNIGVAWNGLGTHGDARELRLAFSMPLGGMGKPPQWEGMGVVGGGATPSSIDPVESGGESWRDPGGRDVRPRSNSPHPRPRSGFLRKARAPVTRSASK